MKKKTPRRLVATALGAVALVVFTAGPAAAYPFSFNTDMISGRIRVVGIVGANFDTPGTSIPTCPAGVTGISGDVLSASGSDNMKVDVNINSPFDDPLSSNDYVLDATGTTGTGTNRGDFNDTSDTFGNVVIPLSFTIKSYNRATCTAGATVCFGTTTLTASGGSQSGAITPFDPGDRMYVNASGTLSMPGSTCPGAIGFVVRNGASLTLGDNPNDDIPPNPPTPDLGAVFELL
jgi:hypothetical protein